MQRHWLQLSINRSSISGSPDVVASNEALTTPKRQGLALLSA